MERRLRCFVSPSGKNAILDWYCGLERVEQADLDAFISIMRKKSEWRLPDFKWLGKKDGQLKGFGELRWQSNRKQFRIVGYFEFNAFVMLIGCIHKQSVYNPAHALETAVNRRKLIESRIGGTCEYTI